MRLIKFSFIVLFLIQSSFAEPHKFQSAGKNFTAEVIHQTSGVIWGFDFLNPKALVYTIRDGKMKLLSIETGVSLDIQGLPEINPHGQGGLLDVKYNPYNKLLYFAFSKRNNQKEYTTVIARGNFKKNRLTNVETIFTGKAWSDRGQHFGARIVFDKKFMYFGIGDRGYRDESQSLASHNGSIIRLTHSGEVPRDNPFVNKAGALPEIYSYGHRNPQGLAFNPITKELWECEFGPKGGDEINIIHPGKNYGWPKITHGREYSGRYIAPTSAPGLEQPIKHYTPSISPSGMNFYYHDRISEWKGNLFLANLSSTHLRRLVIKNNQVVKEEELLKSLRERVRHVRQSPNGKLFISTDSGKIIRIDIQ